MPRPLACKQLKYNSVEIDLDESSCLDSAEFTTRLHVTIKDLKVRKMSAAYLRLSSSLGHLIPLAAHVGFRFHNAEGNHATMLLWLAGSECKVPPFATHHLGVGSAVVSMDRKRLLVVREKDRGQGLNAWKLPGGYVNLGEEISAAAEREVKEETGIEATFMEVLAFRHQLKIQFGRGDLYIICRLSARSNEITVDEEIEDARWMEVKYIYISSASLSVLIFFAYIRKQFEFNSGILTKSCFVLSCFFILLYFEIYCVGLRFL